MITRAKVSLNSVKAFEQAAVDSMDFSSKFNRGISCIEQLINSLSELDRDVKEKIKTLRGSKEKLAITIRSIEEIVARITTRINELQHKVSGMERQLSAMSPSHKTTDENGNVQEVPNPEYVALEAAISEVYSEIAAAQEELFPHEQRLDRAHFVSSQLSSQIEAANSTAYALSEKQNQCKELLTELEDIKNSNLRKSTAAVDNLKKIEEHIAAYLRVKMEYNSGKSGIGSDGLAVNKAVNINININKTTVINEEYIQRPELNSEYIKEHKIKLDSERHICEFEGKKFGGKYNSYKDRIDGTSKESAILGRYDGERGESKYIPSDRNAEGIVVIGILKKYGVDGIEYRNGEPDFEVCAEFVVKIKHMTEFREDHHGELGNFSQADIECAKLWNLEERDGRKDWKPRDVFNYRKANGLTWHEKCDTETMVMVRSEINAYFKHVGGCSECRRRDASADEGGFDE